MRSTHTCKVDELTQFAASHLNVPENHAKREVEERFFRECDKLVIIKHQEYSALNENEAKDDEYGNYDNLAGMIVAFLDFHNIKECLITGPDC